MGAKKGQKRKPYASEEIKFIRDNAEIMFYREIGKILGRSKSSVKNVARQLGITSEIIRTRNGNRKPKNKSEFYPISKVCTRCEVDKSLIEFNKAKNGKFGLRSICRGCQAKEAASRYEIKSDEICAYGKDYREKNREEISVKRAIHTAKNRVRLAEYGKKWAKDNPGKVNAKTARRRAARIKAMPKWLTEAQHEQMEALYVEAARLTKETGVHYEVDHIVPLQGKNVRGLHVPWNLRVITLEDNRRKSRKHAV